MNSKLQVGEEAILIAGPTASGKSRLAARLARETDGEIVNADSMQVYGVLRVLTARPSPQEMEAVPHHLYGHVAPGEAYSTGRWLSEAERAIADIRSRGRLPILVGGTGLYFRALTGGLSDIPPVSAETRTYWRRRLEDIGPQALHRELADRDPEMAQRLKPGDRQRILRAIEIFEATGRSLLSFQDRPGRAVIEADAARRIVLLPDRESLYRRIDERFARMVHEGAIEEVKHLISLGIPADHPVMKAIGVRELAAYLEGRIPLDQAVALAATATRRYAKRQMTWMRNQLDAGWIRHASEETVA